MDSEKRRKSAISAGNAIRHSEFPQSVHPSCCFPAERCGKTKLLELWLCVGTSWTTTVVVSASADRCAAAQKRFSSGRQQEEREAVRDGRGP